MIIDDADHPPVEAAMSDLTWAEITATRDVNCSYRQLDTWIRGGLIHATNPGSGHPRTLTTEEARVLTLMADLVHAGLTPAAAAPLARQLATVHVATLGPFHVSKAAS